MNRWQCSDHGHKLTPLYCNGKGNSQTVAKTYGSQDNQMTIQTSWIKLGICADYARHFFCGHIPIVDSVVMEIVKMLHR